jgi:hypothetical protein
MSAKLMGEVWALDLPHNHQSVLLAFADHANDAGENAFPGTGYVAWKTGYSERQTQRIIDELEAADLLTELEPATGRKPTVYRVVVAAGEKKPPYEPSRRARVATSLRRGNGAEEGVPSDDEMSGRQDGTPSALGRHPGHVGATQPRHPNHEPTATSGSEADASSPDQAKGRKATSRTEQAQSENNGNHRVVIDLQAEPLKSVLEVLVDVAEKRRLAKPTAAAIHRVITEFPNRAHVDVAHDLHFWALEGGGKQRRRMALANTYRNFIKRAPERLKPVPRPDDTDRRLEEALR